MLTLQEGTLIGIVGLIVALGVHAIRVGHTFGRIEAMLIAMQTAYAEHREEEDRWQTQIGAEIMRLRDNKHDLTGTVQRHDGAIRHLETEVGHLDERVGRLEDWRGTLPHG